MIIGLSKHQIDIDETHSFSVHIAFWAISLHSFLWINTTSFGIAYRLFCGRNTPWKWRVLHKNIFPYLYAFSSVCTCCTKFPWLDVPFTSLLSLLALEGKLLLPSPQSQLLCSQQASCSKKLHKCHQFGGLLCSYESLQLCRSCTYL